MKVLTVFTAMFLCPVLLIAAEDANAPEKISDVNTIVNKANLVAYYQGDDGRAKVAMTITDKKGRTRNR